MSDRPISEDDLHAYVDGVLDDAEGMRVGAYLDEHPEVAARVRSYRDHRSILRATFDPIAEEPIPTKLNLVHMLERRSRPQTPWWRAAAAAVVFLVAGGAAGWYLHDIASPQTEGVRALAQEALASFATYASDKARPVELRDDKLVQLVDWATERMGRKPVLPDLSSSGYRLMGGRVVSTPHGAGLMLMYDNGEGTRLVMLTRPMVVDQNRTMVPNSEGNVDGWSWASNGMGYSLVGSLSAEELHPLADDMRRQVQSQA